MKTVANVKKDPAPRSFFVKKKEEKKKKKHGKNWKNSKRNKKSSHFWVTYLKQASPKTQNRMKRDASVPRPVTSSNHTRLCSREISIKSTRVISTCAAGHENIRPVPQRQPLCLGWTMEMFYAWCSIAMSLLLSTAGYNIPRGTDHWFWRSRTPLPEV